MRSSAKGFRLPPSTMNGGAFKLLVIVQHIFIRHISKKYKGWQHGSLPVGYTSFRQYAVGQNKGRSLFKRPVSSGAVTSRGFCDEGLPARQGGVGCTMTALLSCWEVEKTLPASTLCNGRVPFEKKVIQERLSWSLQFRRQQIAMLSQQLNTLMNI